MRVNKNYAIQTILALDSKMHREAARLIKLGYAPREAYSKAHASIEVELNNLNKEY